MPPLVNEPPWPGIADELAHPAERLALDEGGRVGADREVDVVGRRQQVADDPDLEARAADEAEPARARLRGALVEHAPRIGEHALGGRGVLGQARHEHAARRVVDRRLVVARVVEARPGLLDEPAGMGQHVAARARRARAASPLQHRRCARPAIGIVGHVASTTGTSRFRAALDGLIPYQPGRPVELVQRELGLTGPVVKLASNEGQYGPFPAALEAIRAAAAEGNRYPDGGCYNLRAALAERHGLEIDQVVVGNGADADPQLPRAGDARAGRRGRVLLAVVPGVPDQRGQDGRGRRARAARGQLLRPRRPRLGGHAAHQARVRDEPEQPDGRDGRARCARALPRRASRARAARDRRGLLRVRRRCPTTPTRCASTCSRGAGSSCCARSPRSTASPACASAGARCRSTSPRRSARSRTPST